MPQKNFVIYDKMDGETKFDLEHVFCVPVLKDRDKRWHVPSTWLGKEGAYGSLAEGGKKDDPECGYVMKIMRLAPSGEEGRGPDRLPATVPVTLRGFRAEVALQEKAAAAGLSPWVADYWVCADPLLGVIVMPRLWETLGEAVLGLGDNDALRKKYFADAYAILRSLNHIGIWHGAAHSENFMVDRAGKLYIIDFGEAKTIPDFREWMRTYGVDEYAKFRESYYDKDVATIDYLLL